MRRILMPIALVIAGSCTAYAQEPAAKPDSNAADNRMEQAMPTIKTPGGAQKLVPTKDPSAGTDTQTPTGAVFMLTADQAKKWIGSSVYSSDNRKIGEIRELKLDNRNNVTELTIESEGFLGIGATRYRVSADQIGEVKADSLLLNLKSAETKSLPVVDEQVEE